MNGPIKPEDYYPGWQSMSESERGRLAELTRTSNILQATTTDNLQHNPRIPVINFNFFAQYFLGVLIPGPDDQYVKSQDMLQNMWAGCVGSLQHDIDVVNEQNQILFTVPAWIDGDMLTTNPAMMAGESFDRMRRVMEAERNWPEKAVDTYLQGNMHRVNSLVNAVVPEERKQRKAQMWARIFQFYNINIQETPAYKAYASQTAQLSNGLNANPSDPFGPFGSLVEDL